MWYMYARRVRPSDQLIMPWLMTNSQQCLTFYYLVIEWTSWFQGYGLVHLVHLKDSFNWISSWMTNSRPKATFSKDHASEMCMLHDMTQMNWLHMFRCTCSTRLRTHIHMISRMHKPCNNTFLRDVLSVKLVPPLLCETSGSCRFVGKHFGHNVKPCSCCTCHPWKTELKGTIIITFSVMISQLVWLRRSRCANVFSVVIARSFMN